MITLLIGKDLFLCVSSVKWMQTFNAGNGSNHRGDQLFIENFRRFLANEQLLNEVSSGAGLV